MADSLGFELYYRRLTKLLRDRAQMIEQMHDHVAKAVALTQAGKQRQALAQLRKAQALQKKLGLPSRKR